MKKKYVLLVMLAGLLLGILLTNRPTAAQGTPRQIDITAHRFSFNPAEITLKKGEPVVLVFKSEDTTHGLKLPELNIHIKIKKGKPTEVPLTPYKTGDFVGHCAVFCGSGHGSMELTVHVVE